MPEGLHVRPETPQDAETISAVNRAAFGGEVESRLVGALRACPEFIPELSIVALSPLGRIVGHLMFTAAAITRPAGTFPALALAPMAVEPAWQSQGVGSILIADGLVRAEKLGHELVVVQGHPRYYSRFSFVRASLYGITSPFNVPDASLLAKWLGVAKPMVLDGQMKYAAPFYSLAGP